MRKTRNKSHRYELKDDYHHRQTPSPLRFYGKPIILIDGNSFSATAEFCAIIHHHRRAIFVGEESAGAYCGSSAGDALKLTLPHTRLRVHIPIRRYVMAVSGTPFPGCGILPDHEVTPTIADVLSHHDRVMAFAMNRLGSRNK